MLSAVIQILYVVISTIGSWWNASIEQQTRSVADNLKSSKDEIAQLVNELAAIRQAYTGDDHPGLLLRHKRNLLEY